MIETREHGIFHNQRVNITGQNDAPGKLPARWALNKSRVTLGNGMSSKTVSQKTVQTVSPRQWIGIVVVYLLIPMVLLVCGGDFGWWQAWIYSLLIVAAGIGGRIWAEQRHPGLTAERQNIEKIQGAKAWDKVLAPLMALSVSFPLRWDAL